MGLRDGQVVSLVQCDGRALHSNMQENSRVSLGKPRADKGWIIETEDGRKVKDGSRVHLRGVDNNKYMHDNALGWPLQTPLLCLDWHFLPEL